MNYPWTTIGRCASGSYPRTRKFCPVLNGVVVAKQVSPRHSLMMSCVEP